MEVILVEKKYPDCALSGEDLTLTALSMTKKTHAEENYSKISQSVGDISKKAAFSARHSSSATSN
jgi:hypothetical protein